MTTALAVAQDDVSTLVDQARKDFKPVKEEQLAKARTDLKQSMQELERFVGQSTENGRRWLRYLRWDALKKEMESDKPANLQPFEATRRQINRDHKGLENRRYRRLARALQRYRDLVAVSNWDKPDELYGKQLDGLNRALEAYHKEPSPTTEMALSQQIRVIDSIGQAPKLVAALQREVAHPNAYVDIAAALIEAGADPINRSEPITDCILGATIYSDAQTNGTVGVKTIPSQNKAVIEFQSDGHTWSQNVGYKGPAVIRSTADTNFTATKRVELTDPEFLLYPAHAHADTDTHFHSISKKGGGLGSRLVSSMGWKRARQSERQAESIAADHSEGRVERRFNDEVRDSISKARKRYEEEYRRPLERRGELPEHIRFSSDKDSLGFEVVQANRSQLGAAGPPPEAQGPHDMTMRLHQSAVNNYSATLLGGATLRQTAADRDVEVDVELPKWMKDVWQERKTESDQPAAKVDESFKQYALTFRDGRPISVNFADGKVTLIVHIARLQSGEKTFENWDVKGIYTPEMANGGVVLRRDGDLEMLPTNFRGQLSSTQVAERRNLEEELNKRSAEGKGFPKTIEFAAIEPTGELAKAGPLNMDEFSSDGGWVVMAWDRSKRQ
jgi:hypothetical protein